MRVEVRLAGSGGQGIILASIILAEASGVYDGKNVVQSQVYGAAARGEISKADVIISDEEIYFPEVREPQILLTLTQDSYDEFTQNVSPSAVIIVDSFYVRNLHPELNNFVFPITQISMDVVGKRISANIVSLGIISGLTGIVSLRALEESVKNRFRNSELNLKALEYGFNLGQKEANDGKAK